MSKKQHQRKIGNKYARHQAVRSPQKSFLIVVEGDTEEKYFKEYKNQTRSGLIEIVIDNPPCTDPITLVNKAVKLKKQKEREAKNSEFVVPYDEIWVVYDLEKAHDDRRRQSKEARGKITKDKIQFAV